MYCLVSIGSHISLRLLWQNSARRGINCSDLSNHISNMEEEEANSHRGRRHDTLRNCSLNKTPDSLSSIHVTRKKQKGR